MDPGQGVVCKFDPVVVWDSCDSWCVGRRSGFIAYAVGTDTLHQSLSIRQVFHFVSSSARIKRSFVA